MASKKALSLTYRIYRRIRFLCHIARKTRAARREVLLVQKLAARARIDEVRNLDMQLRSEQRRINSSRKKERIAQRRIGRKQSGHLVRQNLRAFSRRTRESMTADNILMAAKGFRAQMRQNIPGFVISINSTGIFILAYVAMWLVSQFMTILAAQLFSYPAILYYYRLYFDISQSAWFQDSVITIYLAGPLACLLIGFIAMVIFNKLRDKTSLVRLLLWWLSLISVTMVFGGLVSGVIFKGDMGYVLDWLYVSDSRRVFIMAIALAIVIIAGILLSRPFLYTGNIYFNELNPGRRHYLFWMQMVIPFFLGSAVILLVRQPHWMIYDTIASLIMVPGILAATGHQWSGTGLYFDEEPRKVKVAWPWILAAAFLLAVYRLGLISGIRF